MSPIKTFSPSCNDLHVLKESTQMLFETFVYGLRDGYYTMKRNGTNIDLFNDGEIDKNQVSKILFHKTLVGTTERCNRIKIENTLFEKKFPKEEQIKANVSFVQYDGIKYLRVS